MGRDGSRRRKTELLAPAGSLEILKAVAQAGADAVYAGGERFGARAYAKNFTSEELREGLDYLHLRGKKLYLTVNTLVKEREIGELWEYLLPLYEAGLDAVIVQDLGVLHFVKEHFPGLPIHASTQMGVTGEYGARMLLEAGCSRIVAARELTLEEISDIYQKTGAELECFVHGSLCYCYSGQCLMSSMIGGRSGNRGRCAQPCRLPYRMLGSVDESLFPKGKKGQEQYFLSPKDLCGIGQIAELIRSGVYSFKIEGRMKQAEYAAGVTEIYREHIDSYYQEAGLGEGNDVAERKAGRKYWVSEEKYKRLLELGNRSGFTDGYFMRHNGKEMMALKSPSHEKGKKKKECGSLSSGKGKEGHGSLSSGRGKEGRGNLLSGKGKEERGNLLSGKGKEGCGNLLSGKGKEECGSLSSGRGKSEGDKEKIKGILRLSSGNPAELVLEYRGIEVRTEGETVQPSRSQPLPEDIVLQKMRKTGGTPFVFSELKVDMEDGVFLTVGALNQLRRKGLELLQEEILNGYRRETPEIDLCERGEGEQKEAVQNRGERKQEEAVQNRGEGAQKEDVQLDKGLGVYIRKTGKEERQSQADRRPKLHVLAETAEQCQIALKQAEVRRIYLEEMVFWEQMGAVQGDSAGGSSRYVGQAGAARENDRRRPKRKAAQENDVRRPGRRAAWEDYTEMLLEYTRQAEAAGKECYLALPYIFRKDTAAWFAAHWQEIARAGLHGFLVRNYEELQFLKERGVSPSAIQGDYQLYVFSREALRGLHSLSAGQFTLPVELNFRELKQLDVGEGEMIVYGRQPLMVSAQCLRRNAFSCDGKPGFSYLEDRLGNLFPMRYQCQDCYNVLYNISPLALLHHYTEICSLGVSAVRISFTMENAREAEQVFGWYRQAKSGGGIRQEQYQRDFTNGHWKRGVE